MNKTSIIMTAFDCDITHRHITSSALGNIQKYTEEDEYELILIDNRPPEGFIDLDEKYNIFKLNKHKEVGDIGFSASMNLGVKLSNQEYPYLCLIQNDVFVWENWLPKLRGFFERNECETIYPSQGRITRQQVKNSFAEVDEPLWEDAGMCMITRNAFNRIGGYDERFKSVYFELAFRKRLAKHGIRTKNTNKVIITHLGGVTTFENEERLNELMNEEGKVINQPI